MSGAEGREFTDSHSKHCLVHLLKGSERESDNPILGNVNTQGRQHPHSFGMEVLGIEIKTKWL